jgi:hypothetical protein
MRNRVINGNMAIDQRNNGASQTFTAAAAVAYSVDRFYASCTGANVTGQRAAGPSGFQYCYQFTGAASVTGILFGQRIESFNCSDFVSQSVTLSANISNSLLTTVTWTAYYANTTDTFTSKTQIATGTFTVSSTATTYQATFNAGANAANGIAIEFTVGAQTSGTWKITGVQLEVGSVATSFERRQYGQEFLLCQRYCQTRLGSQSSTGLYMQMGWGNARSTSSAAFEDRLTCTMRISPSLTIVGAASGFYIYSTSVVTCSTIAYDISDPNTMLFTVTTPATLTNLAFYTLGTQTATAQVIYSAEL